jgi:polyhydroxyalkanoate synthesis repressor PhaR
MVTIKKYSNRRLYDTDESRYVTLEELTRKIRSGVDVRVVDAKTDADLTQATLVQILLEEGGAAKLLPTRLLLQMVRLGDDVLGEFFGSYLGQVLEFYVHARGGLQAMPWNPFALMPFGGPAGMARLFGGAGMQPPPPPQPQAGPVPPPETPAASANSAEEEMSLLRKEIEGLKRALRPRKR